MKLFDFGLRAALVVAVLGWFAQVAGLWPGLFIAPWWSGLAVLAAIALALFGLAIFDVRRYDALGHRRQVGPKSVKELLE
jgi:hypothetical protein